jgi:hypothetical protein
MTSLIGVTHVDTIKLYHSCISDSLSLSKCCTEVFDSHDIANLFCKDCSLEQPATFENHVLGFLLNPKLQMYVSDDSFPRLLAS